MTVRTFKFAGLILLIGVTRSFAQSSVGASSDARAAMPASWTADNGNGTYSNPLFYEEFSDPDVIRVGDAYYLTGTTMHTMPGLPVLRSSDLVNWELASYAFDRLDLGPEFRLEDGQIYGQGIWAPCIRHHKDTFYIFSNINRRGTQIFRSQSAEGPWEHNQLGTTLYDLSVLFDDDGRIWAVSGVNEISLSELNAEVTDEIPDTRRVIIERGSGMGEGLHFYKINGTYYIVSAIPGAHTPMVCARSASLDGPWEVETLVTNESLGVPTGNNNNLRVRNRRRRPPTEGEENAAPPSPFEVAETSPNDGGGLTLHQGGIVDTPSGQWWTIIMQDHNSVGRLSCLCPITWTDGWPLLGLPGNLRRSPATWVKPDTGVVNPPKPLFIRSDDFDSGELTPVWQWNHHPEESKWSLDEAPGRLRLHSLPAEDFWRARNTLTQRAIGPESTVTVELDGAGMTAGDVAGLALLNYPYAWIGVRRGPDGYELSHFNQYTGDEISESVEAPQIWLRAHCDFDAEIAQFSYSADGRRFREFGGPFTMIFQLTTFQGVRYSLFHFNRNGEPGGYADFDNFTVDEARPRGLTQPIPYGKTITLTSGADGYALIARDGLLQAIEPASDAAGGAAARFRVVDRGLGRIALQCAADDRFVSVAAPGDAGDVTFVDRAPGDAETFQWIDLQRGDLVLMSLANHRYLVAAPNEAGPVACNSTEVQPDRRGGDCFHWASVAD